MIHPAPKRLLYDLSHSRYIFLYNLFGVATSPVAMIHPAPKGLLYDLSHSRFCILKIFIWFWPFPSGHDTFSAESVGIKSKPVQIQFLQYLRIYLSKGSLFGLKNWFYIMCTTERFSEFLKGKKVLDIS